MFGIQENNVYLLTYGMYVYINMFQRRCGGHASQHTNKHMGDQINFAAHVC